MPGSLALQSLHCMEIRSSDKRRLPRVAPGALARFEQAGPRLIDQGEPGIWWRLRHNTGNFADSRLGGASETAKKGTKSVFYGPIPYVSLTGYFLQPKREL